MTKGYLGIDIGSISTKGVIIDENRAIIARSYLWTEGNPTEASKNVVCELERQVEGAGVDIVGAGTTGSARRLVGAMLGASVIKNEITAHAVGTTHLHPDVRTILEIGGQDSKIICVSDGIAVDYAMNTLCAAGTGSFLSSQAHRLGVEVEEFGDIALTSTKPANIAARCTVFAESDLVHKIQVGYAREAAYYEKFYFTPGDLGFEPIQTSIGKLGVQVCWDQWYPEGARLMALQGAELLIYPTAIGYESTDTQEERCASSVPG